GVAANPAGTRAYIANSGDNSVSVIDTASHPPAVVTVSGVGASPNGVAVSADGTKVYVASGGGTVSVIDAVSNSVCTVCTVSTGGALGGIAVNAAGTLLYVTDFGNNRVIVISASPLS